MSKIRVLLYLILAFTLLVRVFGLGRDLPYSQYYDEYHTVGRALNLVTPDGARILLQEPDVEPIVQSFFESGGYFHPHLWGAYPPLSIYIQAFAYKVYYGFGRLLGWFRSINDLTTIQFFLIGRFVTALLGTGTVLLVYLIGTRMYSRKIGLVSALFLGFSFLHIFTSRIIKPDVLMVFFGCLSFLFAYLIYERGKTVDYILAVIFLALSVASKHTTVFLILPILLAHILGSLNRGRKASAIVLDKRLLILLICIVGGFFLLRSYGILRDLGILQFLKAAYRNFRRGEPGRPGPEDVNSWLFYLRTSLSGGMGWPLALCSLAGVAYGIWRHKKKDILLLCFPFVFFAFIGSLTYHADHYILPILPFLVILAARFLVEVTFRIVRWKRAQNFIIASFASGILLIPGIGITRYLQIISQEETRIEAKRWIETNIHSGSRIALEHYCPPLSSQEYHLDQPSSVGINELDWYRKRKFGYIVMSNHMYDRYLTTEVESLFYRRKNYVGIIENSELLKEFAAPWFFLYNPNPTIRIYKLDYEHRYVKFPGDFSQYSQAIDIDWMNDEKEWRIVSRFSSGNLIEKDRYIENPYIRLVDPKGMQIAKFIVYEGRITPEVGSSSFRDKSFFLSSLPSNYKIYIGYECRYKSEPTARGSSREIELKFNEGVRLSGRKDHDISFFYREMPYVNAAEYGQIVILLRSDKKSLLFSKISGGELAMGDDYVLNPYVRIVGLQGKEVAKSLIYEGKVGGLKGSAVGPRERSVSLSALPSEHRIYIGYEYYFDATHPEKAGGPLEIEVTEGITGY
ncbi:hypothetical protein ES703_40529 [subsurface metagenome]